MFSKKKLQNLLKKAISETKIIREFVIELITKGIIMVYGVFKLFQINFLVTLFIRIQLCKYSQEINIEIKISRCHLDF